MAIQQQRYQRSVEDEWDARGRAEAHLRTACRTLVATSSDVVGAMTLSIPLKEFGVSSDEWTDIAMGVANDHALHVNVTTRNDHVTVRFSREVNEDGS